MTPHHQRGTFSMRTALFVSTLVLAWAVTGADSGENMFGDNGKGSTGLVDTIIKDLVSGKTQVQLFSVHNQNLTAIIGPSGTYIDLDATFVFDQGISTLDGKYKSIELMAPKKIKNRWPALTGPYVNMVGISDSNRQYIILMSDNGASALDVTKGTISALPLSSDLLQKLPKSSLLSSSKTGTFFYYYHGVFTQGYFANFPQTSYSQSNGPFICNSGQDWAVLSKHDCMLPVTWLKTGYVDDHHFVLFAKDNSLVVFDTSAYYDGERVSLRKTAADQFWLKFGSPRANSSFLHSAVTFCTENPMLCSAFFIFAVLGITICAAEYQGRCKAEELKKKYLAKRQALIEAKKRKAAEREREFDERMAQGYSPFKAEAKKRAKNRSLQRSRSISKDSSKTRSRSLPSFFNRPSTSKWNLPKMSMKPDDFILKQQQANSGGPKKRTKQGKRKD